MPVRMRVRAAVGRFAGFEGMQAGIKGGVGSTHCSATTGSQWSADHQQKRTAPALPPPRLPQVFNALH